MNSARWHRADTPVATTHEQRDCGLTPALLIRMSSRGQEARDGA